MFDRFVSAVFVATLALIGGVGPAVAQSASIEADHIRADIKVRAATVAPGESTDIAFVHTIEPGWHTYWVNPGDSGEPPIFDWTLADGGKAGPLSFPAPQRLPYPPLMNHGYKDNFTLLTDVTVPADWPVGEPYPVDVRVDWLVCEAICIPEGGTASFTIPTALETVADSTVAFTFMQAEWALPKVSDAKVTYARDGDALVISSPVGTADDAQFFAFQRDAIDHAAPQEIAANGEGVTITLTPGGGRLTGTLEGVITSADGAVKVAATGPADPEIVAAATPEQTSGLPEIVLGGNVVESAPSGDFSISLGQAILFAFLGGMLLNLMPCVFPVLALKALGLVQHARQSTTHRAAIGGAYMAGVLASFAALTAVFLGLKASGIAVGWGFQLQEPIFVSAMAVLLFALGLSLSGVFDIGVGLTRLGGRGPSDGVPGSFATGVLATVVASPCTAPFMAVALGAALAASTQTAAAVFAALALGFATPFTLLCVVPGLARILPKPGVWMERLKQALAFPLYASAAWLVWVLAQLTGVDSLLTILGGFVMVALAAWLYGLSQRGAMRSHKVAAAFSIICLVVGGAAFWNGVTAAPVLAQDTAAPARGEPFTPQRLSDLRGTGENVFLNVTAAWCISCKVNERVVLQTERFDRLLSDYRVTYLEADWTRRDPDITRLMEEFGRAGVPLYVFYPSGGAPEILPQILTNAVVEDAFRGG